jgi:hypothetical protein
VENRDFIISFSPRGIGRLSRLITRESDIHSQFARAGNKMMGYLSSFVKSAQELEKNTKI